MTKQSLSRPRIGVEFELPTGGTAQRSRLEDFQTFRVRPVARIRQAIGDDAGNRVVIPAFNSYSEANYEKALLHLTGATTEFPSLVEELAPHILICRRVASVQPNSNDRAYLASVAAWEARPRFLRLFATQPAAKVRCKYCGRFTRYIEPDSGFAYLGTNNCDNCNRGYPAPDFCWDSIDGQAYIYYRHSVKEEVFYAEFEEQFDVLQDHTHFLAKRT